MLNIQTDTVKSSFLNFSIRLLCFLSMILFWLRMILFMFGMLLRLFIKWSMACSVKRFWPRLRVTTQCIDDINFGMTSSDNLLRMNLTVRTFVPRRNSQIWRIVESPNSAFVRSRTSKVSLYKLSRAFSYFSGTFICLSFFLFGLSTFYKNTPSPGDYSAIKGASLVFEGVMLVRLFIGRYAGCSAFFW